MYLCYNKLVDIIFFCSSEGLFTGPEGSVPLDYAKVKHLQFFTANNNSLVMWFYFLLTQQKTETFYSHS